MLCFCSNTTPLTVTLDASLDINNWHKCEMTPYTSWQVPTMPKIICARTASAIPGYL